MIDFQVLRKKILEQAIRGELVPQLDSEPAVEAFADKPEAMPFEIPKKWKWIPLAKLGKLQTGTTPSKSQKDFFGGPIPFIKPADIKDGRISYDKETLSEKGASVGRLAPADTVLMVCIGSIGKCGIADRLVSFNQQINAITPSTNLVISKYLLAVMLSPYFSATAWASSSATTISILNKSKWGNILIPLPSLEEQRRIVQKLESLLKEIDEAEKAYNELSGPLAEQFRNCLLDKAIRGELVPQLDSEPAVDPFQDEPEEIPFEIPEKWKWCCFSDLVDFSLGKTPDRANSSYWEGDVPWVSIADITKSNGRIEYTKEKITAVALTDCFTCSVVPKGTLLMSFKLSIGKVAILDIDAVHNEAIISIRPKYDQGYITRDYLFHVLPVLVSFVETTGAIKGATLNKKKIRSIPVPVPPLEEQRRIVEKLESLLSEVDKLNH